MNEFNSRFLNPHLNYHRPCFFPVVKTDAKGKQKKHYTYERMMTSQKSDPQRTNLS